MHSDTALPKESKSFLTALICGRRLIVRKMRGRFCGINGTTTKIILKFQNHVDCSDALFGLWCCQMAAYLFGC
jgi:hypothetical protein